MKKSSFGSTGQVLLWLLPVCAALLGVRGKVAFPDQAMPEVVVM
jgi:hypothetical protein